MSLAHHAVYPDTQSPLQAPHGTMGSLSTFPGAIPDWSNVGVLHTNTLPPRAHFYSYASEDAALSFDRDESELYSLNGTWKFSYDASPYDAPEWDSADPSSWADIEVPGMWQTQGYGHPHYTNINYPFPVTVPNVSYINPTGSYWREFDVPKEWDGQQIRLRYEGVDSAFHVWVNGEEVGYSQGSRNPSEFDITEYIARNQSNSIGTRVYQWSDATYIEDQDQWWLSGIFRDVYLIPFPKAAIVDYDVVPTLDESLETGSLRVNVTIQGDDGPLAVKVLSSSGDTIDEWEGTSSEAYERDFSGDDLTLWSAETPYLYTVLITFNDRTINQKIGFRRIESVGSNFHVNGKPIILYGVNRHEHHHLHGRTVAYEDMRRDLLLMKRSNINAIRTSHQPPHPSFFDVADELGFYVIAEADLECHGLGVVENSEELTSDNPDWTDAYVDRAEQLVQRLKNHAAIIIWSLGNECVYGENFRKMSAWIRNKDPTRLIHYEQDRDAEVTDMYSAMYLGIDSVRERVAEFTDKPLILCEFAHAMGNGPGSFKEYIEVFRAEPRSQGGLVWEFSNHGLLKKEGDIEYYAYGGDFGDEPNDRDFIMDGLTLSDHTPMPSLLEYAKAIQPVTANLTSDGKIIIHNHYDFSDLSALAASWYIVQDGTNNTESQSLELPTIPAGENRTIDLPVDSFTQETWLVIEFKTTEDKPWAKEGHVVAFDQLYFAGSSNRRRSLAYEPLLSRQSSLEPERNGTILQIVDGDSSFGFDLVRGNVTWAVNGVDLLQRGPELTFCRALTQNDAAGSGDGGDWENARICEMSTQVRDVSWQSTGNTFTIHYQVRVAPKVLGWGVEADLIYTITAGDPTITFQARGDFVGNHPKVVPRIGLMAVLPTSFDSVSWFGRGPGESYKDTKEAGRFGAYTSSVADLFTYYDYPQENGNREDNRWVSISDGSVTLDARMQEGPFSFTASRHMPIDLNNAGHPYELEDLDMVVLNLDYDNHGVGSATVGPRPLEQYTCFAEAFDFTFELTVS